MSSIETENGIITVDTVTDNGHRIHLEFEASEFEHQNVKALDYESARTLGWMLIGLTKSWFENGRTHYRVEMNIADEGGFTATVPSLPGCSAHGWSEEEANCEIRDAIEAWIEAAKLVGNPVPEAP